MRTYLLPKQFKTIGWFLLFPGILLGMYSLLTGFESEFLNLKTFAIVSDQLLENTFYFNFIENSLTDEIAGLLIIVGAIFIAFSRLKNEDEFISKIRLDSLVWATYINYLVLIFAILFVFGLSFFYILVFNMFTILIFFIIRFHWALAKFQKTVEDEK